MEVTDTNVDGEVGVDENGLVDEAPLVVVALSANGHAARQRISDMKNMLGKNEVILRRV